MDQHFLEVLRHANELTIHFGWTAAIPLITSGISFLGGLLGNKKKTTTQQTSQTSNQSSNQTSSGSSTAMPVYDPLSGSLKDQLLGQYLQRIQPWNTNALADNYTTGAIQRINSGASTANRLAQQMLASRGLGYSPAAATLENYNQNNRVAQVIQQQNQRPLLADQFAQDRLSQAGQFLASLPTGQTSTSESSTNGTTSGTTTGTGSSTDPGNPLGGGFASLATVLAGLYGAGAFGNKNASVTPGKGYTPIPAYVDLAGGK